MERSALKSLFSRVKSRAKERRLHKRIRPPQDTTVLIVDDSRTAVFAIKQMLSQAGYQTLEASDAESGIQMAQENRPSLILMDVVMPGLNGFQATRKLRKETTTQNIPIIMISANQQGTDQIWGSRLGANDFLPKPIERRDLFQKIETLLDLHAEAV